MPTDRAPAARRQGRLEPAQSTTRAGTPLGRQGRFLRPCSRLREKGARAAAVIRRTFLFKFGNGPFRAPSFQRGRQVSPGDGMHVPLDPSPFLWLAREPHLVSALAREVLDDPHDCPEHEPCERGRDGGETARPTSRGGVSETQAKQPFSLQRRSISSQPSTSWKRDKGLWREAFRRQHRRAKNALHARKRDFLLPVLADSGLAGRRGPTQSLNHQAARRKTCCLSAHIFFLCPHHPS
jgi:hypothetical protein